MRSRKPIIYGPDGQPIVRAKDRNAPTIRPAVGLGGWFSWGLYDRKGREVVGGEQHNLVLDGLLDEVGQSGQGLTSTTFFNKAVVGTGSTPPDVVDSALANQVGTTSTKTLSDSWTRVANGEYELTVEWEFGFAEANGNLTELGLTNSNDRLLVRELFRDGGGNPITVTKTSDYKLRIKYTFGLTLAPVSLTPGSFTITGIGVVNGEYTWRGGGPSPATAFHQRDLYAFSQWACGNTDYRLAGAGLFASADSGIYDDVGGSNNFANQNDSRIPTSQAPEPYVPGSYQRAQSATWGTDRANITIATIGVQSSHSTGVTARSGFVFVIDPDDRFTKDSLHTLTIDDLLTVSWGRA